MAQDHTICVGTVGSGVWTSTDSGKTWRRSRMDLPFEDQPGEIQIRALAVSPHDSGRLYAGSEVGLYMSEDKGQNWSLIESPTGGTQIWSVAVHPSDPEEIWVGTKPPAVYRTRDGGESWDQVPISIADQCLAGAPKVTNIVFDPRDAKSVWVGVEIDGVYRSTDGGETWAHLPDLGDHPLNQDIHGLTVSPGDKTKLYATTPDGIWTSTDEGQSWSVHEFPRFFENDRLSYCRGMAVKPDNPDVLFVGNGDFIPGQTGAIQRSTDGGQTWQTADLPVEPNSTIYWFGTNAADPDFIVANSLHGYVYTSRNGGESWAKVKREFGEIRAVTWIPS